MAFFKVSIRNPECSSIFITAACLKFFYLSPNILCVRLYVLPCWYFTVVQTSFNTGDCVNMDVSVSVWEREHPPKTSPESLSVVPCAIFCWSGATQHPNKCPETLGINHSFQPTSYLGCFPEMSLFLLCMFSFQSPAVQNHYNHHCCPRQAFFFMALFLQQEVITDRSSLILPENQPKFPIASGHELPSLRACHLIRTEKRIWYLERGKNTLVSV